MSQQEKVRKPRMWLVAWIYKYDVETIVKKLEESVKKQFEDELLEIYSPSSLKGYIFLRVIHPCYDLICALKGVPGIGGVKNFEGRKPLGIFKHQLPFLSSEGDLDCNDLVIVKIGPLRDHIGRVVAFNETGGDIEVELNIFGKMISMKFDCDEIQLVSGEKE